MGALDDEAVTGVISVPPPAKASSLGSRAEPRASTVERRVASEPELDAAVEALLASGETPSLVFQPIVDLGRQQTVGYEALTRFGGPTQATPDRWFMAAERIGRSAELEALVIRAALSKRKQLPADCFLSINVAPEALLSPPVQSLLQGASLTGIVFELTEHSAVSDYSLLSRAVAEIRNLGAFVAVDDAGAGYASLQHILVLRPDFVKLDRALIAGLQLDEAKAALIEMFGGFTSRIDAWLLAEGIEERAELARLMQLGVPLGQGYLLGRPQPQMQPLDGALVESMSSLVPDGSAERTVRHLLELQMVGRASATDAELHALLAEQPEHATLLLLDSTSRPVAFVRVSARGLSRQPAMCVLDSTEQRTALKRALTREVASRFQPLVCCDERGHYRGVIRIERLVEALLPGEP